MKRPMKAIYLIAATVAFSALGAIANPAANGQGFVVTAESKTIDLKVSDMTCGVGCVKKVESALAKVDGVSKANVSMPDKAVVTYDPAKTKPEDLIAALKKAGYPAAERDA